MTGRFRRSEAAAGLRDRVVAGCREASRDARGGVAVLFSLSLLPLVLFGGASYDLFSVNRLRGELQAAADAGALRAARELRLARPEHDVVTPVAKAATEQALLRQGRATKTVQVSASLIDKKTAVRVNVGAAYEPKFLRFVLRKPIAVGAQSVARSKGFPICALGLHSSWRYTLLLNDGAKVTARACAVHSNSQHTLGLAGGQNSQLTASMICSRGGWAAAGQNFNPPPLTDCPAVADPLTTRPPPPVGPCVGVNEVRGGTVTLTPGSFCGGLRIADGAVVTFSPGVYVMKDGPLVVDGGSTLTMNSAGVFLTGTNANFTFGADTHLRLTAPTSGPMAGLLFFQDQSTPDSKKFEILSGDAPLLLGTIYLPKGNLVVHTNAQIAKASAFTVIVAQTMWLFGGTDLVLNSDYDSTDVPVPGGLNPGYSYLAK